MRCKGWELVLIRFVESRHNTPFVWGQHDCCLFAADAVQAITGIDHAEPFRGKYSTAAGAARMLAQYHGIIGYCNSVLGSCLPVTMARRGDAVAIETQSGTALGICLGVHSVFAAPDGLSYHPTLNCCAAWRIA